jgi:hypothetical protein
VRPSVCAFEFADLVFFWHHFLDTMGKRRKRGKKKKVLVQEKNTHTFPFPQMMNPHAWAMAVIHDMETGALSVNKVDDTGNCLILQNHFMYLPRYVGR